MIKKQALEDAQEKANISKQAQTVFRYIDGIEVRFDYTFQHLWGRRRYRFPTTTMVTTVKPVITDTD